MPSTQYYRSFMNSEIYNFPLYVINQHSQWIFLKLKINITCGNQKLPRLLELLITRVIFILIFHMAGFPLFSQADYIDGCEGD